MLNKKIGSIPGFFGIGDEARSIALIYRFILERGNGLGEPRETGAELVAIVTLVIRTLLAAKLIDIFRWCGRFLPLSAGHRRVLFRLRQTGGRGVLGSRRALHQLAGEKPSQAGTT